MGVDDDVFDLGAQSLMAMKALARIRDAFQVNLSLRNLFEHPTVAGLAGAIEGLGWVAQSQGVAGRARGNRALSLTAFLAELRKRDVQVWAESGELRVNAPAGALTPELRTELKQRKGEILAFLASAQTLAGQARALVPLQAHGRGAPVFGVPGHNGDVFCYRALARELGEEHPFFGLQPPGVDGQREPLTRVEDIAAYFAEQIQAFSLQQPCFIAGYCAGGTIAFELAQQLARNGVTVPLLALFGSPYPAYFRWPTQLHQYLLGQAEAPRRG